MSYVIKHNFNLGSCYYMRDRGSTFDEIYDPRLATQFKTVKEARQWIKENSSLYEYQKPVSAKKAIEDYERWVEQGTVRRVFDKLDNNFSRPYDPKKDKPKDVLMFHYKHHQNEDSVRYTDYTTWPELWEVYGYIHDLRGHYNTGVGDCKTEYTFTFSIPPKGNYNDFVKEFKLVLPYVTHYDGDDKVFDIMDNNLGAHGDWVYLKVHPDGTFSVEGRLLSLVDHGTLKQAFNYIKEHRYYN